MSSIKSKRNVPANRDVKTVPVGSDFNPANGADYETKLGENGAILKGELLTLTKPKLIQLPHEEAYLFERQITQADKEHHTPSVA